MADGEAEQYERGRRVGGGNGPKDGQSAYEQGIAAGKREAQQETRFRDLEQATAAMAESLDSNLKLLRDIRADLSDLKEWRRQSQATNDALQQHAEKLAGQADRAERLRVNKWTIVLSALLVCATFITTTILLLNAVGGHVAK